jgi:hypothetical protein
MGDSYFFSVSALGYLTLRKVRFQMLSDATALIDLLISGTLKIFVETLYPQTAGPSQKFGGRILKRSDLTGVGLQ